MPHGGPGDIQSDIPCPFCALVCDDLSLSLSSPEALGCPRARAGFGEALNAPAARPRLRGQTASLADALARAVELIDAARLPLVHGLIGDLLDSRAAIRLAEACGGVVDHCNGDALARQSRVYQQSGWQPTSLGELRNRADLVVFLSESLPRDFPRLVEKLYGEHRLHTDAPFRAITLEGDRLRILRETRALLHDRPLFCPVLDDSRELAQALRQARYPVLLGGGLHSDEDEWLLQNTQALVRELNETGRAALLQLAGNEGDLSAQLCSAWLSGFGMRTGFAGGLPQQDLHGHAAERLVAEGGADLPIWISSLRPLAPPSTDLPRIVIGHPAMCFDSEPDVFLPVGVPGVQRAGFLHRGDGMRLVPLRRLQDTGLPDTRSICTQLIQGIRRGVPSC